MRTMTIIAIALMATTSPAVGQSRPPAQAERAERVRTDLTEQLQSLEARHSELLQRLAAMPDDSRIADHAAVLAMHEADLQRSSSELHSVLEMERQQLDHTMLQLHEAQARAMAPLRSAEIELETALEIDRSLDRMYGDGPRASWAQQDSADSVWRAAREQMNRGQYDAAATLYRRIHSEARYRQSAYRADALYWHAFALNRSGSDEQAREALELLSQLVREYPADQRSADTNSLMTAVQARLAQRGNALAIRQVRETAASDEARAAYEIAIRQAAPRSNQQSVRAVAESQRAVVATTGEARARAVTSDALAVQHLANLMSTGLPPAYPLSLNSQCARAETEIQLIALSSLVRMDSAAIVPVLREVMARRDECAALLRQSALTIVGRIQNASAQSLLVEAARNDPDDGVRRTALDYLGARDPDQAVGIVEGVLRTADDDNERTWALQVLARIGNARAWNVVRDHAGRTDLSVATRRSAIAALSQSNDETHAAFLRDLYGKVGNDTELKETILMSAAFRRGGTDSEWLFAIAQDSNEEARRRELAVSALSRDKDVATQRFVALYDGTGEKQVKLMVVRVFADRAKTESIAADKLIVIARSETDIDLRKAAVLGLPGNDPRARDLLLEILRNR